MTETSALVTAGLGRRYGARWALRECDLDLPAGHVIGLVGPNGAGKSTLLHMAAGLLRPSAGSIRVLGVPPGTPDVLARIGLVAQDKPLYSRFSVADTLAMGRRLNPRFDTARAEAHVDRVGISPAQRVGQLSGGERAQVALALALGKNPELLLLDEPVANLDPLARRQFMQVLLEHAAETGMTVVLSSHLLVDLERACDYLVLLSASRVQLSATTDDLLAWHRIVSGPAANVNAFAAGHTVVQSSGTDKQATLLVRGACTTADPTVTVRPVALEELVLAYMSTPLAGATPALAGPNREGTR
jgi:ABC-2 type transport system ATP-binding protein